ncbi:MAG: 50S ribosomal protein L29 [Nitrososphaerota archaeon]|nr:50S ribosomal protein L29 [Candidatus Bathyarchaeota archaeon]MDW8048274.1 50S ribosomal protein L29 [Nitrososphaerota archaeon]
MAILRMKDIRDMTQNDRIQKLSELRAELLRLKTMAKSGGAIENSGRIREIKRTIARILTVLQEERMGVKTR